MTYSGFEEQRVLHRLPPPPHRAARRQDRRGQDVRGADRGVGAAPRPDGCAGPAVVRAISRRPHRDVRHQDRGVQGMAGHAALVGALRRPTRQERRGLDRLVLSDQVTRLDTKTGAMVQYLLPRSTNIRRVFVDNSTTPVTFWVGNNHGASIVQAPSRSSDWTAGKLREKSEGGQSCGKRLSLIAMALRCLRTPTGAALAQASLLPRCRHGVVRQEGLMEGVVVSAKKRWLYRHRQRRHRRQGPVQLPGRAARARPLLAQHSRHRLRPRRSEDRRGRGRADRRSRSSCARPRICRSS